MSESRRNAEWTPNRGNNMQSIRRLTMAVLALVIVLCVAFFIWMAGTDNITIPPGYVGYVTQGSVFGKSQYIGSFVGPTSTGRMWLVNVKLVSVTPYTF